MKDLKQAILNILAVFNPDKLRAGATENTPIDEKIALDPEL